MSPMLHRIALGQGKLRGALIKLAALPARMTGGLEWRPEHRPPRRHARTLNDHLLRDVGLTRSEAGDAADRGGRPIGAINLLR